MLSAKLVSLLCLGIVPGRCEGQSQLLSEKPLPPDTLITLERPGCFLGCAEYLVTISADGTVTFEGKANVKVKGKAQSKISREKVQVLVAAFGKVSFFSLRDQYFGKEDGCRQLWADSDSATTSIVMNGKSKSVNHYLGCHRKGRIPYPRVLSALEEKIDEVANTKQWVE
jgi:hypothetical protein